MYADKMQPVLLYVAFLSYAFAQDDAEIRKTKFPYIADAVGNTIPPPSNGPAPVGSPTDLLTPDKYEFYTFDESGELVKRLMTLEEIQTIVAAGEGADGHLVTFANNDQPPMAFNYSQPPPNKVNSVLTNVQNVLLAQMEAQKNNPPSHAPLDTPDVSDSWSLILPSIFGNKEVDIIPDKISSSFSTPETDTIEINKPTLIDLIVDDNTLSKEGDDQLSVPKSTTKIITSEDENEEQGITQIVTEKISTLGDSTTKTHSLATTTTSTTTTTTTVKPTTTTTIKPVTKITTVPPMTTTKGNEKTTVTSVTQRKTTLKIKPTTIRPSTYHYVNEQKNETENFKINYDTSTKLTFVTKNLTTTTEKVSTSKSVLLTTSAPIVTSSMAHTSAKISITSEKPVQISKRPYTSSTTKQYTTTTPSSKTAQPLKEIYQQSLIPVKVMSASSISPNLNHDKNHNDKSANTTTLTTQSVSPSTAVSTTEFMHADKIEYTKIPLHEVTTIINNAGNNQTTDNLPEIPLFDVAQSISQIASDLGNNYPIPTTNNLLDLTKDLDMESKENLEIDISDTNKAAIENNDENKTEGNTDFVKISTIDPTQRPQITKVFNNINTNLATNSTEMSSTTQSNIRTTIDPILSESMEDLLSQVVNQSPQSIVQSTDTTSEQIKLKEISTTTAKNLDSNTQDITLSGQIRNKSSVATTLRDIRIVTTTETALIKTSSAYESVENNLKNEIQSISSMVQTTLQNNTRTKLNSSNFTKINMTESNDIIQNFNTTKLETNEYNEKNNGNLTINKTITISKPISSTTTGTVAVSTNQPKGNTKDTDKQPSSLNLKQYIKLNASKENINLNNAYQQESSNNNGIQNIVPKNSSEIYTQNSKIKFEKVNIVTNNITEGNKIHYNSTKKPNVNSNVANNKNYIKIKNNVSETLQVEELKKKIQKVNIDDKEFPSNTKNTSWKLISTVSPPKANVIPRDKIKTEAPLSSEINNKNDGIVLDVLKENQGLEITTKDLDEGISQFTDLCNELAFRYWNTAVENIDKRRSFVLSPYSITSMLAMMFMGAKGSTSGEMNEILKLDDMVTFNPHFILKNISDSIIASTNTGVIVSAFVRELYSDRNKGRILTFYKERAQHFYNGHVEEVNFKLINDIIRRRTNLLVKRYTWGRIVEYMKTNSISMNPPLAAFSANIFQTDCSGSSVEGRDGEMYFVVSPNVRQRRLVPVPAAVYKKGFLAGYDPVLDVTAAAIGTTNAVVSTLFLMPGQQGNVVHGEDLEILEKKLLDSNPTVPVWNRLLRTLLPRIGLELQIPRFSHKSLFNISRTLKSMGLKDLFDPDHADLGGLNGPSKDLHLSDMIQSSTIVTCGESLVGEQHHVEEYPDTLDVTRRRRTSRWMGEREEPRDYQRAFHDPHDVGEAMNLPLHLRPRQARLPARDSQPARLKFDRPFLYFVRHNPTGMILYVGRYNPRLLP